MLQYQYNRVTCQNTDLRSVKTECGQSFVFFFSFTNNSLTFVAKCVRRASPYALISDKFRFNILITTEKYYYIQYNTMDARGTISDRPCWASRFIFC